MMFTESVPNDELLDFAIQRKQAISDSEPIHGFVTIIKNAGQEDEKVLIKNKHNLLTNAGRDYFHAQCYTNTSAGGIGVNYIALSENAGGAAAGHTAVAGEINSGGLARTQASTRTHSSGTNTTTLQNTFTASATFSAVQLSGLLNAASTGTLGHEATFTSVALVSGDTLQVTWTLTLG